MSAKCYLQIERKSSMAAPSFFFFVNTAAQRPIYTLPNYPIPAKVLLPIVLDTYVILKDEDDVD